MEVTIDKGAFTFDYQHDPDNTTQGADQGTEFDSDVPSVKVSVVVDPRQYSVNDSTEFNFGEMNSPARLTSDDISNGYNLSMTSDMANRNTGRFGYQRMNTNHRSGQQTSKLEMSEALMQGTSQGIQIMVDIKAVQRQAKKTLKRKSNTQSGK